MGRFLMAVVPLVLASTVHADDWPQWMGPTRDGVWKETGIVEKFPEKGPTKVWSAPIGGGYSGPAVAAGKVYVTDRNLAKGAKNPDNPFDAETAVPGVERVLCFDATTGKPIWEQEYPVDYKVSYGVGPRCTPTVQDGKVYTLGSMGHLHCFDAATGTILWKKDFKTDYKAKTPVWGFCGHPLVYKNLLICLVGGENALLVAFDKDTGKEAWKALSPATAGEAGYSPPTVVQASGVPQLLLFHPTAVVSVDPMSGAKYWSVPLSPNYKMSIMAPQKSGDRLFVAGVGGAAVTLKFDPTKPTVTEEWRGDGKTDGVYPVNMTPFIDGTTVYAVDQPGMLRAIDLITGKRLWYTFDPVIEQNQDEAYKGAGSGTAFIVKNGDRYFLFNEKGSLIIANLTPEGYKEIDKAKLIEPTSAAFGRKVVWSYPAFAQKNIYMRNDKEIACFSLAK